MDKKKIKLFQKMLKHFYPQVVNGEVCWVLKAPTNLSDLFYMIEKGLAKIEEKKKK